MDTLNRESLAWSFGFAARRLDSARELAGPQGLACGYMLRAAWRAACREVLYLEMFVRRLLVAMAGDVVLAPLAKTPAPAKPDPKAGPKPANAAPSLPGFSITDPPYAPVNCLNLVSATPLPALPLPGTPRPGAAFMLAGPSPDPVVPAQRLAARFAALAAALEAPERYAARIARRLERRRLGLVRSAARRVIRLGYPPALVGRRASVLDLPRSSYYEAERLALLTLNRGPPQAAP
ncbi:MAG: hypothetical protein AAF753_09580 [Pseudomonadota bacterium]